MSELTRGELRRYSRHLLIPEVGVQGQLRLRDARALVVGAGGLGSPVLQYLAAAGVGRIGIVDDDVVDETNLQRQTIFGGDDVGRAKAEVAGERLRRLNGWIGIDVFRTRLTADNARDLIRAYDVVVDCSDNFSTRYAINDAAYFEGKPDVYASIYRFEAQLSTFARGAGPCYRCLFPEAPDPARAPTCAEGGVLGALAGIAGALQASEALKLLLGVTPGLQGRLLLFDARTTRLREVRFARDPGCDLCGHDPRITTMVALATTDEAAAEAIEPAQLEAALAAGARLLDVREPHERLLGTLPGALTIPASQLEGRLAELDSAERYVVACRVGVVSRWVVDRLREAGFTRVLHLQGGLLGYAALHDAFSAF